MYRFALVLPVLLVATPAAAIPVGGKAKPFSLKDVFGRAYTLRSFKKRILAVWYEGKNSYKQNLWLNDRLRALRKSGRLSTRHFESVGIVNYQETAVPNVVIDLMIKREYRQSGHLILCDREGRMQRLWGFRNGRSNIYVFDAKRRLIWKSSGPLTRRRARQLVRFLLRVSR